MVDIDPWGGDYTATIVRNNTILGGFATGPDVDGNSKGTNVDDAIIKYVLSMCYALAGRVLMLCITQELALQSAPELGLTTDMARMSAFRGRYMTMFSLVLSALA